MIEIIEKIISWASAHPDIRALILEGSMVSGQETDELSDYDLNLYVLNPDVFADHNEWLYQFDNVIVYQKPDFMYEQWHIPSRLVVYENSPRVDYSFWKLEILEHIIKKQELPEFNKNGFQVLMDKDGLGCLLCVRRQASVGETAWGRNDIHTEGKNLEQKIDERTKEVLSQFFSGYNRDETLQSLNAMTDFFQKISYCVCEKLEIDYPKTRIENIKKYITKITR